MESVEKLTDENQALDANHHMSNVTKMESNHSPQHHGPKSKLIEDACQWNDTQRLRDLAVSEGGLVSDQIRRKACKFSSGPVSRYVLIILNRANSLGVLPRQARAHWRHPTTLAEIT